jgi:hypothetical protein
MQNFQIRNASLSFEDRSQNMKAEIGGLDLDMSGDFTTSNSRLNLELDIASLNFMQAGVKLAHELKVLFTAAIGIDLENMKFSFKENQLKVNELELGFEGSVEMPDDGSLITDLRFNTQKTDFVTLLSFVPAVFMEGFEDLKTEGNLQFTGYSKGVMKGETQPAFGIDLKVANALVQYPRLPASIHDINIDMQIVNPGGSADKTTVSVKRFELYLADNPVSAELFVSTPVSDPDITADLDMNLDLGTIRDVIPLGNIELSGKLTGRMNINTRMSTIKQEEYEEVGLQGGISLENFRFASADHVMWN